MSEQPYLGRALLASEWDAPIKGGVKKARPNTKSDCLTAGSGSLLLRYKLNANHEESHDNDLECTDNAGHRHEQQAAKKNSHG